jgi:hypothetical protein
MTHLAAIAADMVKSAPFVQTTEGSVASADNSLTGIALPLRHATGTTPNVGVDGV